MIDAVTSFIKAFTSILVIFFVTSVCLTIVYMMLNPENTQPRLNEVLLDPEGVGWEDQYVELYNPGDKTVFVDGWVISSGDEAVRLFGEMGPGQYRVVYGKIPVLGGKLTLKNNVGLVVDEYVFDSEKAGYSAGRVPDGTGKWFLTSTPTPGFQNEAPGN